MKLRICIICSACCALAFKNCTESTIPKVSNNKNGTQSHHQFRKPSYCLIVKTTAKIAQFDKPSYCLIVKRTAKIAQNLVISWTSACQEKRPCCYVGHVRLASREKPTRGELASRCQIGVSQHSGSIFGCCCFFCFLFLFLGGKLSICVSDTG